MKNSALINHVHAALKDRGGYTVYFTRPAHPVCLDYLHNDVTGCIIAATGRHWIDDDLPIKVAITEAARAL